MRQEATLLAENGVQVTTARFVVGQQTYPIANLTSVAPFTEPAKIGGLIVLAIILLLLGIATLSGATVFGVICILGAIGAIAGAVTRRPTHGVVVWTAGINTRALVSHDGAFIHRVVAALNQAIASR